MSSHIQGYIGFLKLQQAVFDTGNEVCHVLLTFSITLTYILNHSNKTAGLLNINQKIKRVKRVEET